MPEGWLLPLTLFPVGVCVGLVGALIGVGGGFFIVPFLLFFYRFRPDAATAASLGTIALGAASACAANVRRKRIDFRTSGVLVLGTLPGAWFGRYVIGRLSDRLFAAIFGTFLLLVSAYLALGKVKEGRGFVRGTPRELVDSDGQAHRYEVNLPAGFAACLLVGLVSSLFGVGGGLILVPFLVLGYGMPTIVASASAQFVFVFAAAAGLAESLRRGQLTAEGGWVILWMGLGVVLGAQAGVAIAKRVRPGLVRGMISAVLATVAALMLLKTLNF